jgi:glycosyltransferase involved in cell wall biosynthesis
MRILVAHNFYQQPGGEDQCAVAEIAMLREFGRHEVIEYFLHNNAISDMSNLQVAARTIWNWETHRELRQLLRKHRPQIAHFHNTFPLISPAAYYAAKSESVCVVQTVHNLRLSCANGLYFRDGRPCEECAGRSVPWPAVLHRCYRQSRAASATVASMLTVHRGLGTWHKTVDAYIALTKIQRDKLIAAGLPAAKIAIKSNFAYPDPGLGAGSGGYAIYVGRLSAEKGVATLLEAWRHLDGVLPLKVLGDGPLAGAVQDAARTDHAIQWLGHRPLEAVYDLIGGATVLVLPSECSENFPRVLIEAFAKGTPVVASRLGAMAEIVDDGSTGLLFQPGDPADLAAKVRCIVENTESLARMRRTARRKFDHHYTARANHEALMRIYERAINPGFKAQRSENKRIGEEVHNRG